MVEEQAVQRFWEDHACGDAQVGGLRERFRGDYDDFFRDYDRFRYQNERHLSACINALDITHKQVLEIGLGEGADSERLIALGAAAVFTPKDYDLTTIIAEIAAVIRRAHAL